jgi:GGDEF domain-containing protein
LDDKPEDMTAVALNRPQYDDPRKLRELLQKAMSLASNYDLTSVMVGISAAEGDLQFPELVDYIGSALRMDDGIVRLTRERSVFFLADANRTRAEEIMDRLLIGFREKFTPAHEPRIGLAYFEVTPGRDSLTVRDVLLSLFDSAPVAH